MRPYTIYFRFRGREKSGQVHHYTDYYLVYFSDDIILQEIGGQLQFDVNRQPVPSGRQMPKDFQDFCKAVTSQLKDMV